MLHTTRIARLEHLLKVLDKTPAHNFDMSVFGERSHACGTHACLLGNAALDRTFNAQGLKGKWEKGIVWATGLPIKELTVEFGNNTKGAAGREFFGITEKEGSTLFFTNTTGKYAKGAVGKANKRKQIVKVLDKYKREYENACKSLEVGFD